LDQPRQTIAIHRKSDVTLFVVQRRLRKLGTAYFVHLMSPVNTYRASNPIVTARDVRLTMLARSHAWRAATHRRRGEYPVMPLQNRVTPNGEIVALSGRGLIMGNRGVLHDDNRRIVRATQVKRWIACRISFRGRRRTIMKPRSYTELFFLDEATAFAAGHRPCAECRHADYERFRALWKACFGGPAGADAMDAVLHAERLDGRARRTWRADVATLPDGTYVSVDGIARIVWRDKLIAWSDEGYRDRQPRPPHRDVEVLTPPSIVAVFKAGYRPGVHPSLADVIQS
jgi:hypothetical protein